MSKNYNDGKKISALMQEGLRILQTKGGDVSGLIEHQKAYRQFVSGLKKRGGKVFGSQSSFSSNEMDATRSVHTTYIYYTEPVGQDLVQDRMEDL